MIITFPSLLSREECQSILAFPRDEKRIDIFTLYPEMADKIKNLVFPKLGPLRLKSHDIVSMNEDRIPVGFHVDTVTHGETHKLLIYLVDLSKGGGTIFTDKYGNKIQHIQHSEGGVVLFDMSLFHKGEAFPVGEIKKTCGLRVSFL